MGKHGQEKIDGISTKINGINTLNYPYDPETRNLRNTFVEIAKGFPPSNATMMVVDNPSIKGLIFFGGVGIGGRVPFGLSP